MKKILSLVLCILLCLSLIACEKMDTTSSVADTASDTADTVSEEQRPVKIPVIMSDDTIMPTYFDISLYDEENYADLYLGKKFKYDIIYCGQQLALPTSYDKMLENGWTMVQTDDYDAEAQVLTGRKITVDFVNAQNKKITAVFYNHQKSSASIKECNIVKFVIKENVFNNPKSKYGEFMINGITGGSAITDMVQLLGAPSHFYCVDEDENVYYLDWFIKEEDKRSGITIYVDTDEDSINSIEVSYYN